MRILGLDFFEGSAAGAVDRALSEGGLIVAPSGTCFTRLRKDGFYREAMIQADTILPDSGLMVSLSRTLHGRVINRISGLAYLNELLTRAEFRNAPSILWVLPNELARETARRWLKEHGVAGGEENFYVAPLYGTKVEDEALLQKVRAMRPSHVVIALSGGVQEKLGFYLRQNATDRAAIHCIGAALGFITGYQVRIPAWADRLYLGWLIRLLSNPRRFVPRALDAFALPGMIRKYGEALPPMESNSR